jgi:hypothetical protein
MQEVFCYEGLAVKTGFTPQQIEHVRQNNVGKLPTLNPQAGLMICKNWSLPIWHT